MLGQNGLFTFRPIWSKMITTTQEKFVEMKDIQRRDAYAKMRKKSNLYRFAGSFSDDMLHGGEHADSACSNTDQLCANDLLYNINRKGKHLQL